MTKGGGGRDAQAGPCHGSLVREGPDVTGIRENTFGWVMLGLAAVAALVMIAAAVTQFVAWVGAVINTAGLNDKTWFIILLVTGLLSFGFITMIIYLVARNFCGCGGPQGSAGCPWRTCRQPGMSLVAGAGS